jgi:decaprenyl-phosphate phosphoribosyltransferase
MLLGLIRSCRPVQWVKNLLVLAAPAAAGRVLQDGIWWRESIIFALFCAAASGIYLVNDVLDREADRAHPSKRNRPIAAGVVPQSLAWSFAGVLLVGSLAGALAWCNRSTASVLAAYIVLCLAYSFYLKHLTIVDMAVLASGFLLRTIAGGTAVDIPLSQWFLITVGFASLMVAGAKRYSELRALGHGSGTRGALRHYTPEFLRFVWQAGATAAVLTYCLWATSMPTNDRLLALRELSIVPMVMVVLRYCQLTDRGRAEEPEEVLLKDRVIQVFGFFWAVSFVVAASFQ